MSEGLRYDEGKPRWDLLPPDALLEIVRIYTLGAQKYADRNWEKGMSWGTCVRALKSHLNKWELGQVYDDDPKMPEARHLAEVAWNAIALLTYELRGIGNNDIPAYQNRDHSDYSRENSNRVAETD